MKEKIENLELENLDGALVVDSREVQLINDDFDTDYDGFIVSENNAVWGFYGFPYNWTEATYVGCLE